MKITKKIAVTSLLATFAGFSATSSAGLFDNLADVAGGALATYGHTGEHRDRRDLTTAEIDKALREALLVSARSASEQLSRREGYASGSAQLIPLPHKWKKARDVSRRIGYSGDFDILVRQLNEASIATVPALAKLVDAQVVTLSFSNPTEVLHSSRNNAASEYLRMASNTELRHRIQPVVKQALLDSGAMATGQRIATRVGSLPMVRDLPTDLTDHVVELSIENFFRQLGHQESAIRSNPEHRTSGLLKKVFG